MMTKTNTPAEIAETTLDDISGGPHFCNFHGAAFDFAASAKAGPTVELGAQFDFAWDVEANQPA